MSRGKRGEKAKIKGADSKCMGAIITCDGWNKDCVFSNRGT